MSDFPLIISGILVGIFAGIALTFVGIFIIGLLQIALAILLFAWKYPALTAIMVITLGALAAKIFYDYQKTNSK